MRFILLLATVLLGTSLFAHQDTIPKDILKSYKAYYKELLGHDVPEEYRENYAQDHAYSKFNYTFYHKVYYEQDVLESYVRLILKKLQPENSEIDSIDIYITRSTQFNAFTIADGSIFVNIGALAVMSSEAELAYLLAHEYAHYQLKHVKGKYLRAREHGGKSNSVRPVMELSQSNEMEADSLGLMMGKAAGYDYRAMDMLTNRIIFMQMKAYLQVNKTYNEHDIIPTTHPIGERRLQYLKLLMEGEVTGSLYPNGKEQFEYVQRLAEFEYLKLLDEGFNLHDMISFPLRKYLLTGEDHYLPTLVRGIRKAMLINPTIVKQGFMTTPYIGTDRFKKKENLIHHLEYEYPDSNEVKHMKSMNVINFEDVPFYTFEQALQYFADTAIALGYQEPLLDITLHYGVKSPKGRAAIAKYLKDPNNLYHEYATKLKKNKLYEGLKEGRKVVLFGGLNHFTYMKKWMNHDSYGDFKKRHQMIASIRNAYAEHEMDYEVFSYKDFVQESPMGKYMRVVEQLLYSGNGKKLLDFDPRIYYVLSQENIKSVEFFRMDHLNIANRRLRWISMIPPITPFGLYFSLYDEDFLTKHFTFINYYAFDNDGKELIHKTNGWIKKWNMSNERAEKLFFKMHRDTRRGYSKRLGIFKVPQ